MWNFGRLAPKYKYIFIERAALEFRDDFEKGTMNPKYFESYKWKDVKNWWMIRSLIIRRKR